MPDQSSDRCRARRLMQPFGFGLSRLRVRRAASRWPAPWAPVWWGPPRPGPPVSSRPGRTVRAPVPAPAPTPSPGTRTPHRRRTPSRVAGICSERGGHRHLAAADRGRLPGQGHQPFGRRREPLLAGQTPLLGHSDQAGDPSVPATGFAQGGDQFAGHPIIGETVENLRVRRLGNGDRFRIHPTYISRGTDTNPTQCYRPTPGDHSSPMAMGKGQGGGSTGGQVTAGAGCPLWPSAVSPAPRGEKKTGDIQTPPQGWEPHP